MNTFIKKASLICVHIGLNYKNHVIINDTIFTFFIVSPCLNITSLNLTDSWVVANFEVLDGEPDTVFLQHSLDENSFTVISEGVNVSERNSGSIFAKYTFNVHEEQYFQLIAYEQTYQSSKDCSTIFKLEKSNQFHLLLLIK